MQHQVVMNSGYQVERLSAAETWLTPSATQHLFLLLRLEGAELFSLCK